MNHYSLPGLDWSPLYRDAEEAARLWQILRDRVPGLIALCVMPDHVHLLHPEDARTDVATALRAYTRYRNHRRGTPGRAVWNPMEPPTPFPRNKLRIQLRYLHLNPCRAGLVDDPLAWPLSTHRDAVGLALAPIAKRQRDPAEFHAYASGDPSVNPLGTELPLAGHERLSPERVARVVAGLYRVPIGALGARGPARQVWIGACRMLCDEPVEALARCAHVDRRTIQRAPGPNDRRVALVCAVAHDRRFGSIEALARR